MKINKWSHFQVPIKVSIIVTSSINTSDKSSWLKILINFHIFITSIQIFTARQCEAVECESKFALISHTNNIVRHAYDSSMLISLIQKTN